MAFTIDNLEIQIETNATKATHGLDSLAASLAKLKMSIGDTSGLASNLKDIATALETFSSVGKIRMTVPINQLKKLGTIVPILGNSQATQMADNLKKIAESIATFSAMSGVGKEMKDAAKGMDALAKSSQKFESATNKANEAHKGTIYSLSKFVNQYRRLYQVIDEVVDVCADLFVESNEYIEALNLFKVSMGEASDAALKYAETVSAAMGIDPAEWISNQGTFQRMITGFGIVSEEAEIMSQNLTQLAYDISSFFNTDITTAMQRLQSGMSGQIKGLKAWGYNLSVAALQETALSLGIEESVRNMTEAQKAQLRYITLIQKSNGIMGDMAKTINTPANAMRILNAQITLLKRSLGNIVSVIATRVIPYIQAFVEVMAEGARALAEAWGFEIKDLPTNNLEMASDVIDGIGDDVDNTTDAVAGLKRQLAGFDELNILSSNKEDDAANQSQASLNIDIPSYDFLSNLDNETRRRIDEIKVQIKDLTSMLGDLAKVFAMAFAVSALVAAKNAIKLFFTEAALGIGIMDAFVDAMQSANLVFEVGDGIFKSLKAGVKSLGRSFKTAMSSLISSLSPVTKAFVSIVALGLEFVVVKNAVYDLVKGNKSLGESLLAIIPICGAVGVAMYAMLGPWGLVAAAVTAVIGAIVGFAKAEEEMRKQLANDTFYDGYGKTISDLATEFDGLMVSATEAYVPILEIQDEIISSREKIKKTSEEVATLVFQVESGATRIEDAIPTIVDAFKTLYNDTRSYLTDTASLIYSALAGNVGKALTDLGIDIQGVSQATGKVTNEALAAIDALNSKNAELEEKHKAGLITDDEFYNQLAENIAAIQKWSGISGDTDKAINDAKSGLMDIFSEGINWDSDNLVGDLEGFKTAADNAKTTIEDAYGAVIDALEEQKRLAQLTGKDVSIFDEAIEGVKTAMTGEVKGIDNMLSGAFYALQEDMANSMAEVYDKALEEYDNLGYFKQWWYNFDAGEYANAVLKDFKEDTLSPVVDKLKEALGEDEVFVDEIISQVTGEKKTFDRETVYSLRSDELGIKEALEESGKDTIAGLISGLTSEQKSVYDESRKMGLSVLEAYDEALDINSPSREMEKRGGYTIEGLVNGLTNNMSLLDSALDDMLGRFDFLSTIQGFWKKVTDWWRNISLPDVDLKMPHFSWTTQPAEGWVADILKTIGLEPKLPKLNVEWYASGGFPTMGQMFIARERGPELVGRIGNKNAVVNNDQIITGIASAVYSAMMAAHEDGNNGEGGSTRIVVQIGDQAVGEASVRYINGRIVQTGESPIYS